MKDHLGLYGLSAKFLEAMKLKGYAPASLESFDLHLKPFMAFLEGRAIFDLRRVRKEDLLAYQVQWAEAKTAQGMPYRWGTLCLKIRVVKRFFEWQEATGQVLLNPAEDLREPLRTDRRLPRNILTEERARKLLETPDMTTPTGVRNRAVLEVLYSSGIRLSELTHLTLNDVDFEGGLLRVNKGKGAKDRVVPLGMTAVKVLRGYTTQVRSQVLSGRKEERLFLNHLGQPLSELMVQIIVREHGKKAGLPVRVTPHVLRHSFATQLVRNGAPVELVSRMLGHSDLSVTHVYVRVAGAEVKQTHRESHPRERTADAVPEAKPTSFKVSIDTKEWNHERV